jgi:ribonuclease HI
MNISIFADGGSRGNPGPGASGFVVYKTDLFWKYEQPLSQFVAFQKSLEIILEKGVKLGMTTNNQAEWQAVLLALKEVCKDTKLFTEIQNLQIFLDSQLVVRQILGQYKVKNQSLKPFYEETIGILKKFKSWQIFHIPRKYNTQADKLLNQVLDNL